MKTNRRGLILLAVLLAVAALVYVIKNPRNNAGSYEGQSQKAAIETQAPESRETPHGRVMRGSFGIGPDLR